MADQEEENASPPCKPKHEGWLMKRSKHFHAWKPRWTTLWEGSGSRDALDTTPELRGTTVSESFMLARMLSVRAVEKRHFGREHCLILDYFEGAEAQIKGVMQELPTSSNSLDSGVQGESMNSLSQRSFGRTPRGLRGREIGLQAKDDTERDAWVQALTQAWQNFHRRAAARTNQPSEASKDMLLQPKQLSGADEAAGATSAPSSARGGKGGKASPTFGGASSSQQSAGTSKGKPKAPPPPLAGKGKGPGKAPPAKGASKGAGTTKGLRSPRGSQSPRSSGSPRGSSSPMARVPRLPLGKRILLKDAGEIQSARDRTGSGEGRMTIFDNLFAEREQKVREDIEVLQNVFRHEPQKPAAERRIERMIDPKKKEKTVLTSTQAQNFAIVARTLPLHGPDLAAAVESLLPGPLDLDKLDRLATALPGPEVMKQIQALEGPEDAIRSVERQLMPIARIVRLEQRLRVLSISARLDWQQERFNGQMQVLQQACGQLRHSEILRVVLGAVLVMFNYINFGKVGRNTARAFDIHSLLSLSGFKTVQGPFPAFNGLHFVALRLLAEKSNLTVDILEEELKQLHDASDVSLAAAQSIIDTLRSEAEFLRDERRNHPTAYGRQPRQQKVVEVSKKDIDLSYLGSEPISSDATIPNPPTPNFGEAAESQRTSSGNVDNAAVGVRSGPSFSIFRTVRGWYRKQAGPEGNIKEGDKPLVTVAAPKGAPSGTWLMLGDPDGATGLASSKKEWAKVWAEVKAPGILCYIPEDEIQQKRSQAALRYAVFAGAEVVPFVSPLASSEGREAADERPTAFELQNVVLQGNVHTSSPSSTRLWLDADVPREAICWSCSLKALSAAPGAGFLWVHQHSIWRWRWVVLDADDEASGSGKPARLLVWYRTPGEFLRGEPSIGGIRLGSKIEVCTFRETRPSDALRTPFGFEVVNFEETAAPVLSPRGEKAQEIASASAAPQTPRRRRGQVQAVTAEGASQKLKAARRGQMQGVSTPSQKTTSSTRTFLSANSDQDLQRWVDLLNSDSTGGLREDLVIPEEGCAPQQSAENIFAFIGGPISGDFGASASSAADAEPAAAPDTVEKAPPATPRDSVVSTEAATPRTALVSAEEGPSCRLSVATSPIVSAEKEPSAPPTGRMAVPKLRLPTAEEEAPAEAQPPLTSARKSGRVSFADATQQESSPQGSPREGLPVQLSARKMEKKLTRRNSKVDIIKDANVGDSSCSDSSSESSSGSDSDDAQKLPIHRLRTLMARLKVTAHQLKSSLGATTTECRQVLAYFGQRAHDATPILLAQQVQEFLKTIDKFWDMLRKSFIEVQKHRQNCARKGLPDPVMMAQTAQQSLTSSFQFAQATPRNSATPRASLASKLRGVKLFGPNEDAGQPPSWKQKMQAKKSAKALIMDVVRKSIVQLYARGAVELAVWRGLMRVHGVRHPVLDSEDATPVSAPLPEPSPSHSAEDTSTRNAPLIRPSRQQGRASIRRISRPSMGFGNLSNEPSLFDLDEPQLPQRQREPQPAERAEKPRRVLQPTAAQVQDLFNEESDDKKQGSGEQQPDEVLQAVPFAEDLPKLRPISSLPLSSLARQDEPRVASRQEQAEEESDGSGSVSSGEEALEKAVAEAAARKAVEEKETVGTQARREEDQKAAAEAAKKKADAEDAIRKSAEEKAVAEKAAQKKADDEDAIRKAEEEKAAAEKAAAQEAAAEKASQLVVLAGVRPQVGSTVRAKASGRCAQVIVDDSSELPFKLQYHDGQMPLNDWLQEDAVELLVEVAAEEANLRPAEEAAQAEARGAAEQTAVEEEALQKAAIEAAAKKVEDDRAETEAAKKEAVEEEATQAAVEIAARREAERRAAEEEEALKRAAAEAAARKVEEERAAAEEAEEAAALAYAQAIEAAALRIAEEKAVAEADARREAERKAAEEEALQRAAEEAAAKKLEEDRAAAEEAEAAMKKAAEEEAAARASAEQVAIEATAQKAAEEKAVADADARREAERKAAEEEEAFQRAAAEAAAKKLEEDRAAAEEAEAAMKKAAEEEAAAQKAAEERAVAEADTKREAERMAAAEEAFQRAAAEAAAKKVLDDRTATEGAEAVTKNAAKEEATSSALAEHAAPEDAAQITTEDHVAVEVEARRDAEQTLPRSTADAADASATTEDDSYARAAAENTEAAENKDADNEDATQAFAEKVAAEVIAKKAAEEQAVAETTARKTEDESAAAMEAEAAQREAAEKAAEVQVEAQRQIDQKTAQEEALQKTAGDAARRAEAEEEAEAAQKKAAESEATRRALAKKAAAEAAAQEAAEEQAAAEAAARRAAARRAAAEEALRQAAEEEAEAHALAAKAAAQAKAQKAAEVQAAEAEARREAEQKAVAQQAEDERAAAEEAEAAKRKAAEEEAVAQVFAEQEQAAAISEARREVAQRVEQEQAPRRAASEAAARKVQEERAADEDAGAANAAEEEASQTFAEKVAAEVAAKKAVEIHADAEAEESKDAESNMIAEERKSVSTVSPKSARKTSKEKSAFQRVEGILKAAKDGFNKQAEERAFVEAVSKGAAQDSINSPRPFQRQRSNESASSDRQGVLLQKAVAQAVTQDQRVNRWKKKGQNTKLDTMGQSPLSARQPQPAQQPQLARQPLSARQPQSAWQSQVSDLQPVTRHIVERTRLPSSADTTLDSPRKIGSKSETPPLSPGRFRSNRTPPLSPGRFGSNRENKTVSPGRFGSTPENTPGSPGRFRISTDNMPAVEDTTPSSPGRFRICTETMLADGDCRSLSPRLFGSNPGILQFSPRRSSGNADNKPMSPRRYGKGGATHNAKYSKEAKEEPLSESSSVASCSEDDQDADVDQTPSFSRQNSAQSLGSSHSPSRSRPVPTLRLKGLLCQSGVEDAAEAYQGVPEEELEDLPEEAPREPPQVTPQESPEYTSRGGSEEDEPIDELTEVFGSDWTAERFSMSAPRSSKHTAQRFSMSTPRPAQTTLQSSRDIKAQIMEIQEEMAKNPDAPKPPGVQVLLKKFESSAPSSRITTPRSPRWSSRGVGSAYHAGIGSEARETPRIRAWTSEARDTPRVRALAAQFSSQSQGEESAAPQFSARDRTRTAASNSAGRQHEKRTEDAPALQSHQFKVRRSCPTLLSDSSAVREPPQSEDAVSQFDLLARAGRVRTDSGDSGSAIFSDAVNKLISAEEKKRTSLKSVFDSDWTFPHTALTEDSDVPSHSDAASYKHARFDTRRTNPSNTDSDVASYSDAASRPHIKLESRRKVFEAKEVKKVTRVEAEFLPFKAQMRTKQAGRSPRRKRVDSQGSEKNIEEAKAPTRKSEVVVAAAGGRPRVGSSVRVKESARCGQIIVDDGSELPFKVEFSDGGKPVTDWFRVDAVDVLVGADKGSGA